MNGLATTRIDPGNLEQSRAWDGDEGAFWAARAARFDACVAAYHRSLMRAAEIGPADHVLDVGCGTGQTTRDAARAAPSGRALGVDLSHRMLTVARDLARAESLANVDFACADAQVHRFVPGSFDLALSRSGTMFFADPVAAFGNIAAALRPGGRLALVVWQPVSENEWFRELTRCMAAGRDLPAPPPGAPGPFALSEPRRIGRILAEAGFGPTSYAGLRRPMFFGTDPEDAFGFTSQMLAWMLAGLDDAPRGRALADLRSTMRAHHGEDGVTFGSAMWLVTAQRG